RLDVLRNRMPQAFARAEAAVAGEPTNALVRNMRGELYLATKDFPKAAEDFRQALPLAPTLSLPYRNLALAQIATGDMKSATGTYETAIAAVGMNPTLVIDLAALYE